MNDQYQPVADTVASLQQKNADLQMLVDRRDERARQAEQRQAELMEAIQASLLIQESLQDQLRDALEHIKGMEEELGR